MATIPQIQVKSDTRVAWKTVAVVLPFLVLFWVNIAHHTMFFDEVNAWAISAASPTLSKLFYYVHFEGHPWLWYFILWFPSRLTHDPVGMKWVEAALGTGIILILGTLSPFTYKQRALILSSYFLVWEYTVMCRMYSVMLLLVLFYVWRRAHYRDGVVVNCALLGLAANTDMTGVLLSSALLVEYVYTSYVDAANAAERRAAMRRWLAGALVYVALVGLSVATLWPSKDISWQTSGHLGSKILDRHQFDRSIGDMIAAPWWPISPQFPHHFWETSARDARWLYLLMPAVLYVYWRTFRRNRNLLLLMAATLLFGIVFADVVYEGHVRHWGIAFVSFVVGLWLQAGPQTPSHPRSTRWPAPTYAILAVSALAGVLATVSSWHRPFSQARAAATWLKQNVPENAPLTGAPDVSFASAAEELQRPVLFLECNCVDTFKLFSKYREGFDEPEIPAHLNQALDRFGTNDLLFVFYRGLQPVDNQRFAQAHLSASLVKEFSGADMLSDNYFIYRVRRTPPVGGR